MTEAELRERLAVEGLAPPGATLWFTSWSNGPGDRYPAHRHDYDKVLLVERGSIVFALPEQGRAVELSAGHRLDLPAGTLHAATVGREGVACLEAHLPRGSLTHEKTSASDGA
jgi:quercetin dioxygenase-like cupin family protein